ncbi:Vacuolar protein sorting-associated protein 26A [Capsicum annuum]|nr:Vacuolar protein sorting-associated protein 26A [Capsicum annuum]
MGMDDVGIGVSHDIGIGIEADTDWMFGGGAQEDMLVEDGVEVLGGSAEEEDGLGTNLELCHLQNYIIGAFKPACNISITFGDGKSRKPVPLKKENGQTVMVPLFQSQENIAGKISVEPVSGKKAEHNGIKVELLGQIVRELDVPGEIYERKIYPFEFSTVEMPYETYNGVNVRLSYVAAFDIRGFPNSAAIVLCPSTL